jgi:hypothetical protein
MARLGLFDGTRCAYWLLIFGSPGLVLWKSPYAPPISAKKPFIFSDIVNFIGRNYLILRKMTCRYVSTKELRVFLNWSGAAEDGEPLPARCAGLRCPITE